MKKNPALYKNKKASFTWIVTCNENLLMLYTHNEKVADGFRDAINSGVI